MNSPDKLLKIAYNEGFKAGWECYKNEGDRWEDKIDPNGWDGDEGRAWARGYEDGYEGAEDWYCE